MAIKILALSTIIVWDAELERMLILNPGDSGEAGEKLAQEKIDNLEAERCDDEGAPENGETIAEARARYTAVIGKRPSPKWSIEQIDARISAAAQDSTIPDAAPAAEGGDDEGAPE